MIIFDRKDKKNTHISPCKCGSVGVLKCESNKKRSDKKRLKYFVECSNVKCDHYSMDHGTFSKDDCDKDSLIKSAILNWNILNEN